MKHKHLKQFVASALITILATNLIGCSALFPVEEAALKPPLVKQSTIKYSTTKVDRGDVEISYEGTAQFESAISVNLTFKEAGGRISYINNTLGTVLKQGDIVAELDNAFIKKSLEQAKINLKKAEINYEALAKGGSITPNLDLDIAKANLDQQRLQLKDTEDWVEHSSDEKDKKMLEIARLNYKKAEAEYEQLLKTSGQQDIKLRLAQLDIDQQKLEVDKYENELKCTILRTTVSGPVQKNTVLNIGDTVTADTLIALVEDGSSFKIVAKVNPADMPDLVNGSQVFIKYEDKEYKAHVIELPDKPNENNFMIVPDEKIPNLKPAQAISFKFIKTKHPNVLRIPRNAVVIPLGDTSGVATVSVLEDNVVVEKQVILDLIGLAFAEIKAGLNEGDLVVLR